MDDSISEILYWLHSIDDKASKNAQRLEAILEKCSSSQKLRRRFSTDSISSDIISHGIFFNPKIWV